MNRQQSDQEPVDGLTWAVDAVVVAGAVLLGVLISRVSGWSLGTAVFLCGLGITGGVAGLISGHKRHLHAHRGITGPAVTRAAPRSPRGTDLYDDSYWPRPGHGQ